MPFLFFVADWFATGFAFHSQGHPMQVLPLSHGSLRACSSRFYFYRLSFAMALVVMASMLSPNRAHAQVIDWKQTSIGFYDVFSNWLGGVAPSSTQTARFNINNSYTVRWDSFTASQKPSVGFLRVNAGQAVFLNTEPPTQWEFAINGSPGGGGVDDFTVNGSATVLTIRGLHLKSHGVRIYRKGEH